MIRQLQDAMNETLDTLYDLPEDYLQQPCGHVCARGGSARDQRGRADAAGLDAAPVGEPNFDRRVLWLRMCIQQHAARP